MHLLVGLFAAVLATAAVPVRVTPVSGGAYEAQWEGVGESGLLLRTGDQLREVPLQQLQQVQQTGEVEGRVADTTVQLRDGTRLAVDGVTVQNDRASLRLRRQSTLEVPMKQLQWIRFQPPTAAVESQWQGLTQRHAPSDTLVVRRGPETLDQVGGIIQSISDTQVEFTLDGQVLKAPRERLEGILLAGAVETPAAPPVRLRSVDGSVWHAAKIAPTDEAATIRITTLGGLEHTMAIDAVRSVELSSGVAFLAASEPVESNYQPYIGAPDGLSPLLQRWLGPQSAEDRNLVLRSRSSLSYRIEPGFRQFVTTAEVDPSVSLGGKVQIRCLLDGQPVWDETLTIEGGPRGLELPLGKARRLTIEVDYGGDGDVGDVVWMRQPRFIK